MSVRHSRMAEACFVDQECSVVLAGDAKVGKTALAQRFVNARFSEVSLKKEAFLRSNPDFAAAQVGKKVFPSTGQSISISGRTLPSFALPPILPLARS